LFTHQYSWFKVGSDSIYHDVQRASCLIVPVIASRRQLRRT